MFGGTLDCLINLSFFDIYIFVWTVCDMHQHVIAKTKEKRFSSDGKIQLFRKTFIS